VPRYGTAPTGERIRSARPARACGGGGSEQWHFPDDWTAFP